MATRLKANTISGPHTAGIYSDMTVDGPEIGTLVVIVDRAKNLPNRKSMGKQDPYCAVRLGKEAKKTETDKRGGQTPKWDQELRFIVHDSPDYCQLKVSVFNDDKKTDLIGEAWVSLHDVLRPGGGQNDLWHNLNCRGKYAGEIRIEITYYDSRPKPEKASDKARQSTASGLGDDAQDSMIGARQPRLPAKRRPLPSDPTLPSPAPVAIPEIAQTQPRGHHIPQTYVPTQSPLQAIEYNTSSRRASHLQQSYKQSPSNVYNYDTPIMKNMNTSPGQPMQDDGHGVHSTVGGMEYSRETAFRQSDLVDNQRDMHPYYEEPIEERRPQRSRYDEFINEQNRDLRPHKDIDDQRRDPRSPNAQPIDGPIKASWPLYEGTLDGQGLRTGARQPSYESRHGLEYAPPPSPGGPPPPPPLHRSKITSSAVSNVAIANETYDSGSFSGIHNAPFEPPRQEDYLSSAPAYPQSNIYQAYTPNRTQESTENYEDKGTYKQAPRHVLGDEYNGFYSTQHSSVRDPTSSPTYYHQPSHNVSASRDLQYQGRRYDDVSPPAPLNLSGLRSAASETSAPASQQFYTGTPSTMSPLSHWDSSQLSSEVSSRTSHSHTSQQSQSLNRESRDDMRRLSGSYIPSVPPTLIAGMDPAIAQEVSERIYHENRASYSQNATAEHGGRYTDRTHHWPNYSHAPSEKKSLPAPTPVYAPAPPSAATAFVPEAADCDERQDQLFNGAHGSMIKPRAISPDHRVPARKSISPSPGPSSQQPRLSDFPYGPDAYDVLNPNITSSATRKTGSIGGAQQDIDVDAKIIMHDGREVDPSDHLPETSWAPEPEVRTPKQPDGGRSRPSPSGAQQIPSSGPRPLRREERSPTILAVDTPSKYMSGTLSDPSTPASQGHNRLQKKPHRNSIQPMPHSSPLSPVTQYSENRYSMRSLPRARTIDLAGEERYGSYSTSTGSPGAYARDARGGGPPIPAKVPLNHSTPPALPAENVWALEEEMRRIDIGSIESGSSRSRRRNIESNVFL